MGKFAARMGDPGTPPHAPGTLTPGPGSATVIVDGKPAWRTNVDTAACTTPIAPPAPAPHGPEICYLGSISVMIDGQMAVRQGDMLVAAGPPNPILMGSPTVLIGDVGFGLLDPANMAEFCKQFAQLVRDWPRLTPEQRRARLEQIANNQLAKSGLPTQSVAGSASLTPGNAQYDFPSGRLEVSQAELNSPTLSPAAGRSLANSVYHESRHAEQWYLMARQQAGAGASAAQIQSSMGVPANFAASAAANPLTGTSAQGNLAGACWNSVYGPRGAYRNGVLNNINNQYSEYRALPEEQDAWNTGDSLPCGKP
jgi:uncharacterized Zn-binding protein involved in type VI secretion